MNAKKLPNLESEAKTFSYSLLAYTYPVCKEVKFLKISLATEHI